MDVPETGFLTSDYGDNPVEEYIQFFCLGIDGLFADFPDTGVTNRELFKRLPRGCENDEAVR